jgi:CYTH domain-containing protein
MGQEIERKFLVNGTPWTGVRGEVTRQGYLSRVPERTVRVRIMDDRGFLTIKGKNQGASRAEFEYPIPADDAAALLALCEPPLIEKTRYRIPHVGHVWEIDVFHGDNDGLVVAEVELRSADESFQRPSWVGEEVTDDPRYYNANLVKHPFSRW